MPQAKGKFPIIVMRNPYVDQDEEKAEQMVRDELLVAHQKWLDHGYAVVYQHCRGRGKSSGDCIPYINERADGLQLLAWVRQRDFYAGEIYLSGASYCCSVHYVIAPYAEDIKGAVFQVQDTERYNICYRNGFLKIGLHGSWYVGMYKRKTIRQKNYTGSSFHMLPLSSFTQKVFGEPSADFDEMLQNPSPKDGFWSTHNGGVDARNAIKNANFPILLITGMFDIYTGGIFDMWRSMEPETRANAALVIHPYDHGGGPAREGVAYPSGRESEQFEDLAFRWLQYVRGGVPSPVETGKMTYYSLFENCWKTDEFTESGNVQCIPPGRADGFLSL